MSRASVRSAVTAFFAPPAVAGLNNVFRSEPRLVQGQQFFAGQPAGVGSGAIGIVFIEAEREQRRAIGGATSGKKRVDYEVGLIVKFRSNKTSGQTAMDDYDIIIDGIKTKLRSDRTLGSALIFSAGEGGEQGVPDIEVISDLPKKDEGNLITVWGVVKFKCCEWLTA